MWIFVAVLSAVFAGLTAILCKCGVKNANSDVAIAVRISVVFAFSWIIVLATGAYKTIADMSSTALISIILSGVSTGACWICYFKALSIGDASKVAAVDKSSVALSVLLAIVIFPDERALWWVKLICLVVIIAGTILMTDIKRGDDKRKIAWLIFAILSAVFSTATSLLGKIGT
ncbi:MAG: EamA family transporter, partial [Clostridia bacterium]|nr:EamA family transporter [Clostridia bacterium]